MGVSVEIIGNLGQCFLDMWFWILLCAQEHEFTLGIGFHDVGEFG